MCLAIFAILWAIRTRMKKPGTLFGIYLMFNGLERFVIEKIRVNPPYKFLGIEATQAELIATALFIGGLVTLIVSLRKTKATPEAQSS